MQDVHLPRSAQPHLQGDVRLPGSAIPAFGCHAHPLRLQQAQHEAEGDDRMDFARPQQLRGGGAHPLDSDERVQRTAGLPLAQFVGVLTAQTAPSADERVGRSVSLPDTQEKDSSYKNVMDQFRVCGH